MTTTHAPVAGDLQVERSVLGAAIANTDAARQVAEMLQASDFSGPLERAVYLAIADVVVAGDATSAGVVFERFPPDRASEISVSSDLLQTWAIDSPAAGDPGLLAYQCARLQKTRYRREMVSALREVVLTNPFETGDPDLGARLHELLERADARLSAITNGHRPEFRRMAIGDALDSKIDEPPWLLSGWLAKRDYVLFVGDSGTGKSWLLVDLAWSLLQGVPWLDDMRGGAELKPQRVMYVDEEQNELLTKYRMRRWVAGNAEDSEALRALPLNYLVENSINLDTPETFRRLSAEVDRFRPDWIFFDSLVRVHKRNENDNSAMSSFFTERVRPLASRVGAGVIVLHHISKPSKDRGLEIEGRARGAGDIKGQVDGMWTLEEDPDSGGKILRQSKTRWGARHMFPLKIEIEDVLGGQGTRIVSCGRADDAEGAVLEVLTHAGMIGASRQEIIDRVKGEGVKDPTRVAAKHLADMYAAGNVRKRREARAVRYWLTMFAPADSE